MFGMLSVLAELQRELIVANTRDGLDAARARGRNGGRRPKLNAEQIALAQQLYDAGERPVQQIADIFNVARATVYGHWRMRVKASGSLRGDPEAAALPAPRQLIHAQIQRVLRLAAVACQTHLSMSDAERHLTVLGDRIGSFVIEEELPDGRLVIRPEAEPSVAGARPGRAMTQEEFEAFMAEHGPRMLPGDDEG